MLDYKRFEPFSFFSSLWYVFAISSSSMSLLVRLGGAARCLSRRRSRRGGQRAALPKLVLGTLKNMCSVNACLMGVLSLHFLSFVITM
jgi:hypothetical protein